MRKILLAIMMIVSMATIANAQLYAPCYANYQGIGYFALPNGYYYGWISGGYPQGEGYYCFVDPQMGQVFYHGYFDRGLCNGKGEVMSNSGYICGTWSHGDFVSQTNVQSTQMQQSYYDVWSNYWNYFATTPSYNPSYTNSYNFTPYFPEYTYSYPATYSYPTYSYPSYDWSNYSVPSFTWSTPSYSTPSYSTPSTNYHANNDVKIPANTKITQIDSDTQLGRQLLGKIGR